MNIHAVLVMQVYAKPPEVYSKLQHMSALGQSALASALMLTECHEYSHTALCMYDGPAGA